MTDAIADELGRIAMSPNLAATLARAGDYARAQAHAQLTLEHLLLALAEDADAALVLTVSNIDVARLVAEISEGLGRIEERVPPERAATASLAVAPDLRRILEAAAAAARQSRRRDINGAIVLAAIVGDGRSTAAHLLRAQGLTFEEAIRALQRAQAAAAPRPAPASAPPAAASPHPPSPLDRAPASTDAILASARERVQTRAAPGLSDIRSNRPAPELPVAETRPERQAIPGSDAPASPQSVVPSGRTPGPSPELPAAPPQAARAAPPHQPAPELRAPHVARGHGPAPHHEEGASGLIQPAAAPRQTEPTPNGGSPSARHAQPGETQPRGPEQPRPPWPAGAAPRGLDAVWSPQRPQDLPLAPEAMTRAGPRVPPAAVHHGHPAPGTAPAPTGWRGGPTADGVQRQALGRAALREAPRLEPGRDISAEDFARELRAPASAPAGGRRRHPGAKIAGQLVENIPRRMRLSIPVLVEARVGRAEVQALAEGLEGGGAAYRHEVVVTKAMSVRLRAPDAGFWIEAISPETQWIGGPLASNGDEFAGWRWNVTPRLRGRRRLQLLVSAHTIGADGLAAETALPDQLIEVKVRTNYAATALRWSGWLVAAILGGVLARFGEEFYAASARMAARIMSGG